MKIRYQEVFKTIKDAELGECNVLVGFDAVLDHLVKVVKHKNRKGEDEVFSSIQEFGSYLSSKSDMSCFMELKTIQKRIGGNMAILSQALASFGAKTTCIGTMGSPEEPVYREMSKKCQLYSIAPYGICTALEFKDGKIMLAEIESTQISWEDIEKVLEESILYKLIAQSDMICLVNWSEMINANEVWQNILNFSRNNGLTGNKKVFFDLADFSNRSEEDIMRCVSIIYEYGKSFSTILGLNENEARNLTKALNIEGEEICKVGYQILEMTGVDILVIHTNTDAYTFEKKKSAVEGNAFYTETPIALTGAGDNFNAGFCTGLLMGQNIDACTLLGNASSGYYARYGRNTDLAGLKEFIQSYLGGEVE